VTDALASLADKIRPLIRLLSSDQDGEVVAAARALNRTLKRARLDIHVLADSVGNGKLSEVEMRKLYDAGFEAGKRAAENANNGQMFRNVNLDDEPSWHDIATECATNRWLYGTHEKAFLDKMVRRTVHGGEPSEKEANWLRKIYARGRR
jgi:hypothetical protein